MPLTKQQLAARTKGIGGSDAAAVIGRHPTKTALDVYLSKVYEQRETDNSLMEAGRRIEPVVTQWASDESGVAVSVPTETLVHPEHPWMVGNLDGRFADGRILEVKCLFMHAQVRRLEELGSTQPLPEHFWQGQHYLALDKDAPSVVFAYYFAGNMRLVDVPRDEELIALLVDVEGRFWRDNVLARVEPTPQSVEAHSRALALRWPKDNGLIQTASPLVVERAQKVAALTAARKAAELAEEEAKNALKELVGEDLGFDLGPFGKVTNRTQPHSTIDAKGLRKAHPDIAKEFTRTTTHRKLLVKVTGGEDEDE